MTEWVTIKIPEETRDAAKNDPRTYYEIMEAGLETNAPDDIQNVIQDLKDQISMLADPGTKWDERDIQRMVTQLDEIEERTGRIENTLENLQR